jgi:UDP-glucose 4-epimerase
MESKINNGNLLITGGSGVLGSYIIELLKEEFDVVVADIVRPGANVKYLKVDLTKPFSLSKDFEICIHLAAHVGGIQHFTRYPVENIRDNPKMTTNLYDAAINSNLNRVIYTSSSRVYENQVEFPTTEESAAFSPPPSSPYGMSKLIGEYICKAYHEEFGINYTILRPSNVYGPREAPDPEYAHVIPELVRKVLSGKSLIEIYGDGEQTRTFTHGKDAAQAYKLSIENTNAINETFNLSGNEEVKIIQVLELIWNMTRKGEKLKIKQLPFLPYDTKRRFLSNKKIQEKLNWKPIIGLKEGLFETVESLRKVTDSHHSQL